MRVSTFVSFEAPATCASPKSISFASGRPSRSSLIMMFDDLMSRWTTPDSCAAASPSAACLAIS